MKTFFSPCPPDYSTYTFPYGVYALPENNNELQEVYEKGFLPYTGDLNLKYPVFYKARSLRVDLEKFSDSSENRRVAKKFEGIEVRIEASDTLLAADQYFRSLAIDYAAKRFKGGQMDSDRLDYILSRSYLTHTYRIMLDEETMAYLLAVESGNIFHYWFCFFDLDMATELPLGKFLMWKGILMAKEKGCSYIYLGTCYGNRSLYKARDFKGVEFHDGNFWSSDVKRLKMLCKSDDGPKQQMLTDELKNAVDSNKLIQSIFEKNK